MTPAKRYSFAYKAPKQSEGTALVVRKRPRTLTMHDCEMGCVCKGQNFEGQRKAATHVAVVLGHVIWLCQGCSKLWPRAWDWALAGCPGEDMEKAA